MRRCAAVLAIFSSIWCREAVATPSRARTKPPTRAANAPKDARGHAVPRERFPAIPIFGAHVGEALVYRPFDGKGRARRDAARALEHLLRCRQTGARHRLHPRLGDALYQIGRHYAGRRIEIFSGYRPRAFCDRAHSRHMSGSAIDFVVEGVSNEELVGYLRKTFHPAGVGFYPRGVHVHLDVERAHDTYWVDAGPPPPATVEPADPAVDPAIEVAPHDTAPLAAEVEVESVEQPAQALPLPLPPPPDDDPEIQDETRE